MVDRKTPDPTSRSVWYFLVLASLFCWFVIWEGLKIFEKSQEIRMWLFYSMCGKRRHIETEKIPPALLFYRTSLLQN
jgi:hypothetical protein